MEDLHVKHTRTGGIVALAIASSLALSACGSDSNGSSASSTSSASAPTSGTAATTTAAAATGGAGGAGACATGSLSGAGSSFQGPMQDQWAKDFAAKCAGAKVDYQPVG